MNYIPRNIDKYLLEWKDDKHRKPLLLRGARQVGKSSSIRNLGKSFKYFLEINLEKHRDVIEVFRTITDVHEIAERLSMLTDIEVVPGETLLFIDEIQISEDAIRMLRYFKEDYPELHVAAAGSLLEFALADLPSFGVGRVSSLFMYPLSFRNFLQPSVKHGGLIQSTMPVIRNRCLRHYITIWLRSFVHICLLAECRQVWLCG